MPSSSSGARVQAPRQSPAPSSASPFSARPGPQVEQVEEVGGEDQQRHVGEVAPRLEAAAGDDVGGERQRADRLDRAGREPPLAQRPGVAAPAARRVRLAPPARASRRGSRGRRCRAGRGSSAAGRGRAGRGRRGRRGRRAAPARPAPPSPAPPRAGRRAARRGSSRGRGRRRAGPAPRRGRRAGRPRSRPGSRSRSSTRAGGRGDGGVGRPSRSGSRRSALPLTPKLPSAPSRAKTVASRPATRSTSSTLERSLPWKKEIEDGSAVAGLDADRRAPWSRRCRSSAPTRARRPTARCTGPMSSGWSRTTITPSRPPKLPLAREKRWPRTCSSRVPPRTIWRPSPTPKAVSVSGVFVDVGEAGLREVAGERVQVDRLADDADADQPRPGRPERVLDRIRRRRPAGRRARAARSAGPSSWSRTSTG